jgi:hypothetical protein
MQLLILVFYEISELEGMSGRPHQSERSIPLERKFTGANQKGSV